MGIDAIINTLQGCGCSPFFFTSAIQSVFFGAKAREQQDELLQSNLEFRERMQELRNEFARERLDAQLRFRRECYELGRQYLIQQTISQNESRKKQIEFHDFLNRYWPLEQSVFSVLMEREKFLAQKSIVPLTVYIARTELTAPKRSNAMYEDFCEKLITSMQPYGVTVEKCPWKAPCQSRLGEAMNVNYIMGGIPSLIVFPYQQGNKIGIESASWSFAKGLQSMNYDKSLQIECLDTLQVSEYTLLAVQATIGMTRDAYMLAEYHSPVLFGKTVDDKLLAIPEIREQLSSHYSDMISLAHSTEFRNLCTLQEISQIEQSLNLKLLQ